MLDRITDWLDYLGGAAEEAPGAAMRWWAMALWWGVLLCLIAAFSGQTSKFIYIDF